MKPIFFLRYSPNYHFFCCLFFGLKNQKWQKYCQIWIFGTFKKVVKKRRWHEKSKFSLVNMLVHPRFFVPGTYEAQKKGGYTFPHILSPPPKKKNVVNGSGLFQKWSFWSDNVSKLLVLSISTRSIRFKF